VETHNQALLGRAQAAQALGISVRMLDSLVEIGQLKPVRLGRRVLFRPAVIERFARRDHSTKRRPKPAGGESTDGKKA